MENNNLSNEIDVRRNKIETLKNEGVIVYKATTSSGTGYFNDDERPAFLDKAKAALSDFYNSVHTI